MKKEALALVPHVPWTLLGLLLFLGVFVAVIIRVYLTSTQHFEAMAALPLDDKGVRHE